MSYQKKDGRVTDSRHKGPFRVTPPKYGSRVPKRQRRTVTSFSEFHFVGIFMTDNCYGAFMTDNCYGAFSFVFCRL